MSSAVPRGRGLTKYGGVRGIKSERFEGDKEVNTINDRSSRGGPVFSAAGPLTLPSPPSHHRENRTDGGVKFGGASGERVEDKSVTCFCFQPSPPNRSGLNVSKLTAISPRTIWGRGQGEGGLQENSRSGLTLIEMLVSMTLTLIIVFAMLQVFEIMGDNVTRSRATLEMAVELRDASSQLQEDLQSVTVPVRPWVKPSQGLGYFEYIEGFGVYGRDTKPGDINTTFGDCDDILMFTARSQGEPFVGQVYGQIVPAPGGGYKLIANSSDPNYNSAKPETTIIVSDTAEIIWWTRLDDTNNNGAWDYGEVRVLHRRVLLVRPDIILADTFTDSLGVLGFFNRNDISARKEGSSWVASSLGDLTKRENRFAHLASPYPHLVDLGAVVHQRALYNKGKDGEWGIANVDDNGDGNTDEFAEMGAEGSDDILLHDAQGEDVILSHVLAFDVKAWDPEAPITESPSTGEALAPGDYAYDPRDTWIARGAYVDLFYAFPGAPTASPPIAPIQPYMSIPNKTFSQFSGPPAPKSKMTALSMTQGWAIYDTWSFHYEHDGLNQDLDRLPDGTPVGTGTPLVDEGTNQLDDNSNGVVDESEERETSPPYPVPLRGLQVILRTLESDTRQIRQETVVVDFVPE